MNLTDIIKNAKVAQNKLKVLNNSAEHIYALYLQTNKPTLVFISDSYNDLDFYTRTKLATQIHSGPFSLRYYILGTKHIDKSSTLVTRSELYNATKIYGKTPLLFENSEYASISDTHFIAGKKIDAQKRV